MLLQSLCPRQGFSFRAYVQPIVQPGAVGSHWFMFEGVQSRRNFSFIAHENKKKKKKNWSRDLHNVGEEGGSGSCLLPPPSKSLEPTAWLTSGLTFSDSILIFLFLKDMNSAFWKKKEINCLNRQDHKLRRSLGENACWSQTQWQDDGRVGELPY